MKGLLATLGACLLLFFQAPSGPPPGPTIILSDHYHALLLSAPHKTAVWWDTGRIVQGTHVVVLPPKEGIVGFYDERAKWSGQYRFISSHEGKALYEVEWRPVKGVKQVWQMTEQL